MKLKLRVTAADGVTSDVVVRPVTQVALEREYKKSITEANGAEHMYWMAWHASGKPGGKYDDWLDQVDDVSPINDEDEVDPLVDGPPLGGSLPSPSSPAPD